MRIHIMQALAVACFCSALAASCGQDGMLSASSTSSTATSASGAVGSSGTGGGDTGTGATGASTGAGGGGAGATGGGGTGTGGGGSTCAASHHEGTQTQGPLDLYIMLDKSGSMSTNNKWVNCTNALKMFVQSPEAAGIGVGLQYFPITSTVIPPACQGCTDCACIINCGCTGCSCIGGLCMCTGGVDSCQVTDYATPAVEIGVLPGNAAAIVDSMNSKVPTGGTPTRPALEGALIHAKDWALANPGRKVVAVLATDGEPTGCATNTIPAVQNIAQMYFNGIPSIPTYVIGVGANLNLLHGIAQSGGTGMAYIVDGGPNTTQQFLDAMNAIRGSGGTLACEYDIPALADGGPIDFDKVNVQYIPGNGDPPVDILHAQTAAQCDPVNGGWYYDSNAAPMKILLCPTSCITIENDDMSKIDILYGCPTILLPPP